MRFNSTSFKVRVSSVAPIATGLSLNEHPMYIHRKARLMPQILKIVLIGGDEGERCPKCDAVAKNLKKKGLTFEKRFKDYENNPAHEALAEIAKERGDMEAPLICIEDESGNLELFGAGVAYLHVMKLGAREKDLQDALIQQEAMANA